MNFKDNLILLGAGIVIGFFIGMIIFSTTYGKKQTQSISEGVAVKYVIVKTHTKDTTFIPVDKVKWYAIHDTAKIGDSIIPVTMNCIHAENTYPDSSFVAVDLCSRYFPTVRPPDLKTVFTKRDKPDSTIIFKQRDTLTLTIEKTKISWSVAAVATLLGVIGGYMGHK